MIVSISLGFPEVFPIQLRSQIESMVSPALSSIFQLTDHEIYVLTASHGGLVGGQVATWVMPTTLLLDRLRIVASLSPFNYTYGLIESSQRFVVHMLASDQAEWLPRFGLQSGHSVDKFADLAVDYTASGIPVLPNTCGWAECQVIHQVDTGDRRLCIADVIHQQVEVARKPLSRIAALEQLPASVALALGQKRLDDCQRDRQWIKNTIHPHL